MILSKPIRVAKSGRWVAKLVTRLLATAALWIRIQSFVFKNTKWVTYVSGQHTLARKKERIFLRCIQQIAGEE
jgi:hypothetical protein